MASYGLPPLEYTGGRIDAEGQQQQPLRPSAGYEQHDPYAQGDEFSGPSVQRNGESIGDRRYEQVRHGARQLAVKTARHSERCCSRLGCVSNRFLQILGAGATAVRFDVLCRA